MTNLKLIKIVGAVAAGAIFTMSLVGALTGCAQNTEAPTWTEPVQEQAQAAQGSQVYVTIQNAPGKAGTPFPPPMDLMGDATFSHSTITGLNEAGGETTTDAGYVMSGPISVTINTGNTTPSMSGTQAASPVATIYPVQDVKPEVGISVPVAITGQGTSQAQASASGHGDSTADFQATVTQRLADLEAKGSEISAILDRLTPIVEGLLSEDTE